MDEDRRVRLVRITTQLLSEWMHGNGPSGVQVTTAPPDLRVIGIREATIGDGTWTLVVWSATFTPISDPYDIPFIDIEYSR